MLKTRKLTPYEKNQLLKYGIDQEILINSDSPVEYVTGHVDFHGLDLLVTNAVLIPRIETEELVDISIEKSKILFSSTNEILRIVDVGTGSGAIAISLADNLKKINIPFEITALDISDEALKIAQKNFENINPKLSINFIASNFLSEISDNKKIDLIIANLPYIPSNRIKTLDNSVRDFEPHLALDGGIDGLDLVRKLLEQAETLLSEHGLILLELDITHTPDKMKEFENEWDLKIIESKAGGVNFAIISHQNSKSK